MSTDATTDPVVPHAGGEEELVRLDPDHPGFRDPVYRQRRNQIARLALEYRPGEPPPMVDCTDAEHGVWRVSRTISGRKKLVACPMSSCTTSGSGVYRGIEWWRMYCVERKTPRPSEQRNPRAEINPATGSISMPGLFLISSFTWTS